METSTPKRLRTYVERTPGIIFTLSTPSKLQVGCKALLALFDQIPKSETSDSHFEDDELSVSKQIAKELQALHKESKLYRYGSELSRGVGFISFNSSVSPTKFLHTFLTSHCPPISPAFVYRLIPVEIVCAPNLASFTTACLPLVAKQFQDYLVDRTWKLIFDKHALTNLSKEIVLDLLHSVIPERHEASITSPDVVVMVQTFQSICGVAFLEDYEQLCQYNIHKLVTSRNTTDNDS